MPKKVPLIAVTVHRDNRPFDVPVNKPFNFTDDEVNEVEAAVPGALRDPVNEAAASAPAPAAGAKAAAAAKAGAKAEGGDL
jgi:hypothetical protein